MAFTELSFLMGAQFFMDYQKTNTNLKLGHQRAARERVDALKQISIRNALDYNAQLNINRQHELSLKKFGLDSRTLDLQGKREIAKYTAERWWMAGDDRSGSFQAGKLNIERHLNLAKARKNINQRITEEDFFIRRNNQTLKTKSANNAALSGLTAGPSSTTALLDLTSSGLQIYTDYATRTGEISRG